MAGASSRVILGYIKYLKDRAMGADLPGDAIGGRKTCLLKSRADFADMEAECLAEILIPANQIEEGWAVLRSRMKGGIFQAPWQLPVGSNQMAYVR